MVPAKKNHRHCLAEKIIALLAQGITADTAVCTYIETTFSTPSLTGLQAILADETNEERDSLIDLILFPDEAFQVALAPLLTEHAFSAADQKWVIRYLSKTQHTVVAYFPMLSGHASLALTASAIQTIVERLNICWQPDPALRKVVDNQARPDRRIAIYVRLRNANLRPDPPGIRLLCRFLKVFATATDFFEIFDFMVGWVARINGEDAYSQLMAEKLRYVEAVRYAVKFEQMQQADNMETLMLRGIRAPTMGVQEAAAQIDKIDRLVAELYGQADTRSVAPSD